MSKGQEIWNSLAQRGDSSKENLINIYKCLKMYIQSQSLLCSVHRTGQEQVGTDGLHLNTGKHFKPWKV